MTFRFLTRLFKRNRKRRAVAHPYPQAPQGKALAPGRYPPLAEIVEIRGLQDLANENRNSPHLPVDGFEHGNLDLYTQECERASMTCAIEAEQASGEKALTIHYRFESVVGHYSADIARKFIQREGIQDWSAYANLNLVLKVNKATSLLRVCIVEEDGDWWDFINTEIFEADRWYLVRIPMRKMFLLEDSRIRGDGIQDLSRVAEVRFIFDCTNPGQNPRENTLFIDRVFLSR